MEGVAAVPVLDDVRTSGAVSRGGADSVTACAPRQSSEGGAAMCCCGPRRGHGCDGVLGCLALRPGVCRSDIHAVITQLTRPRAHMRVLSDSQADFAGKTRVNRN